MISRKKKVVVKRKSVDSNKSSDDDRMVKTHLLLKFKGISKKIIHNNKDTRRQRVNLSRISLPLVSNENSIDEDKMGENKSNRHTSLQKLGSNRTSINNIPVYNPFDYLMSQRNGKPVPDSSNNLGILKKKGIIKNVQTPLNIFEIKNYKTALDKTLQNNKSMKSTIESFYTHLNKDKMDTSRREMNEWNKRMKIGLRQTLYKKDPMKIQEEVDQENMELGLLGRGEVDMRERKEDMREYYYKAFWNKKNSVGGPYSNDTFSRMMGWEDTLLILTKNYTSLMIWRVELLTAKITQHEIDVGLEMDRYAFSACAWQGRIVIYGGQGSALKAHPKYVNHQILIIDPIERKMDKIRTIELKGRKNATAIMLSNVLVIHGGYDSEDRLCSSLITFSMQSHRYSSVLTSRNLPALESHSMIAVIKHSNLKPFSEITDNSTKNRLMQRDGIYIFGGIDNFRILSSKIYRLKILCNPLIVEEVVTVGNGPSPRQSSSMNYLPKIDSIVIFGGKNKDQYFCDLFVCGLIKLEWMEVKLMSRYLPTPRSAFSTSIYSESDSKSKLYVFGGVGESNFVGGSVEVLDFDTNLYVRLKKTKDSIPSFKDLPDRHSIADVEGTLSNGDEIEKRKLHLLKKKQYMKEKTKNYIREAHYLPAPLGALKKITSYIFTNRFD